MNKKITLGIGEHFIGTKKDFESIHFTGVGSCICFVLTDGNKYCASHCMFDKFDNYPKETNIYNFVDSAFESFFKEFNQFKLKTLYVVGGASLLVNGFGVGNKNISRVNIIIMDNNLNVKLYDCGGHYTRMLTVYNDDTFDLKKLE